VGEMKLEIIYLYYGDKKIDLKIIIGVFLKKSFVEHF
jgi:hypothetical protein